MVSFHVIHRDVADNSVHIRCGEWAKVASWAEGERRCCQLSVHCPVFWCLLYRCTSFLNYY